MTHPWTAGARLVWIGILTALILVLSGRVYVFLAWIHLALGRPRRARVLLRWVARRRWPVPRMAVLRCEATASLWEGRFEAAIARADELLARTTDVRRIAAIVELLLLAVLLQGEGERGRRLLEEHRDGLRRRGALRHSLTLNEAGLEALLAFHEERLEACRAGLEVMLRETRRSPAAGIARFFLAAVAHREGRQDDARALLSAVVSRGGDTFIGRWGRTAHMELAPSGPPPIAVRAIEGGRSGWRRLVADLGAGVRDLLLVFRAPSVRGASYERVAGLVVVNLAVAAAVSLVGYSRRAFFLRQEALALLSPVAVVLAAAYLASRVLGLRARAADLAVGLFRALPIFFLAYVLAHRRFSRGAPDEAPMLDSAFALWWIALVVTQTRRIARTVRALRPWAAIALVSLACLAPLTVATRTRIWIVPSVSDDTYERRQREHERSLYAQADAVNAAEAKLLVGRPGVTDLYFVGVAGWAAQDVFLKEIRFAQHLFDERFGTADRSIALANDPSARGMLPLATTLNLAHVLQAVGARMNRNEDILFLLVTSHGSNGGVALEWGDPSADEETLDPKELREELDRAGIKWRVLMISACSSGVFVEPLRDEFTLVATAAAAGRKSFGCTSGNDFTEFGRAVLGEQLTASRSFVDAFERARTVIGDRESARRLEPSMPQLFVGDAIASKLRAFEGDAGGR